MRELIAQAALSKIGCGYIYGATGWICTEAHLQAQAKQYPAYADKIFYYGRKKWMGKQCYDCAQLARAAAKAAGISLVSGANSQWTKTDWAERGTIDTLPEDSTGLFLFIMDSSTGRMKHVGVSVGSDAVEAVEYEVEARGHAYGVVKRRIKDGSWTHWARLKEEGEAAMPDNFTVDTEHYTIRKGAKGALVVEMQGRLLKHGGLLPKYGADGDFGSETETAVKIFQGLHALTVDGICGPATWAALLLEPEENPPAEDLPVRTLRTLMLTEEEYSEILAKYGEAVIPQ